MAIQWRKSKSDQSSKSYGQSTAQARATGNRSIHVRASSNQRTIFQKCDSKTWAINSYIINMYRTRIERSSDLEIEHVDPSLGLSFVTGSNRVVYCQTDRPIEGIYVWWNLRLASSKQLARRGRVTASRGRERGREGGKGRGAQALFWKGIKGGFYFRSPLQRERGGLSFDSRSPWVRQSFLSFPHFFISFSVQ